MAHRYSNLDPSHRPHGAGAILRWGLLDRLSGARKRCPPGPPAPLVEPDLATVRESSSRPRLTWLGHASFLGTLGGRSFLIDPVFSRRAGPPYPRHVPPGLGVGDLPELAAVMVTHNHFDHLDEKAMRALPAHVPVVVPEGLGGWCRRRGRERVVELGWWQEADVGGLRVTLVPARHWSRRGLFDTNRTLWGGYVVEGSGCSVYHAGDTASFAGFTMIGRRFPALDAALLPVGGYRPGWFMEHHHLNPEQAGQIFLELGARCLVPMHWGVFQLTDEPLSEPAERIRAWWQREVNDSGRRLGLLAVGETLVLEQP